MSFGDLDSHIQFLHCHQIPSPPILQNSKSEKEMSTFMDDIVKKTQLKRNEINNEICKKQIDFLKRKNQRNEELMINLTKEYYNTIKEGLIFFANKGKSEMVLQFDYSKFCANYPELGNPKEVALRWLEYLTSPNNEKKIKIYCIFSHLNGLKYSVKTKYKFSKVVVHFSWI